MIERRPTTKPFRKTTRSRREVGGKQRTKNACTPLPVVMHVPLHTNLAHKPCTRTNYLYKILHALTHLPVSNDKEAARATQPWPQGTKKSRSYLGIIMMRKSSAWTMAAAAARSNNGSRIVGVVIVMLMMSVKFSKSREDRETKLRGMETTTLVRYG
jgi:hypothetical protein